MDGRLRPQGRVARAVRERLGFGLHRLPLRPLVPLLGAFERTAFPEPERSRGDVDGSRVRGDALAAQLVAQALGAAAEDADRGGAGALGDEVEAIVEEERVAEEPDRPRAPPPGVDFVDLGDKDAARAEGREDALEDAVASRGDDELDVSPDYEPLQGGAEPRGPRLEDDRNGGSPGRRGREG